MNVTTLVPDACASTAQFTQSCLNLVVVLSAHGRYFGMPNNEACIALSIPPIGTRVLVDEFGVRLNPMLDCFAGMPEDIRQCPERRFQSIESAG